MLFRSAHGRARARGEQRGLLRGRVRALGREQEAGAEHCAGDAEREERGGLGSVREAAGCEEKGVPRGQQREDRGHEGEGWRGIISAVSTALDP